MPIPVNNYEIKLEAKVVLVRVPKSLKMFTLGEWVRALKRGKHHRRHGGERLDKVKKLSANLTAIALGLTYKLGVHW